MSSLNNKIAVGAAWSVGGRILERTIGLVSTVILARLLTPGDFGLVAMATAVIAVIELLGAFGLDSALIQNQDADRTHYDTAWTIGLIYAVCAATLLALAAHPMSQFYSEPRLESVMYALALAPLINGFQNVGIIKLRKDLHFSKDFVFRITNRMLIFVATTTAAYILRNYWALIIGMLTGATLGVISSYLVHEYRPRLSLVVVKQLFRYSKWMFISSIAGFINQRSADFVIAKFGGASSLGVYSLAAELANLAGSEVAAPLNRALMPGYSKMQNAHIELKESFLKVMAMLAFVCLPASIGIGLVADELSVLLLGNQWSATIPLIKLISLATAIGVLQHNCYTIFLALGTPRTSTLIFLATAIVMLLSMLIMVPAFGVTGAAYSALISALFLTPTSLTLVAHRLKLSFEDIIKWLWKPIFSVVIMATALNGLQLVLSQYHFLLPIGTLVIKVSIGILVYASSYYIFWIISGKTSGPETYLLQLLPRKNIR